MVPYSVNDHSICRASARPPAFLPTMPRIPSRLEGKRVSFLNGAVHSGRNLTQAVDSGLNQSEAFLPLSRDRSDVVREHDITLPIKGKCVQTLGALRSDLWLWILGLPRGDRHPVVDGEAWLSSRDLVFVSKGKIVFTPFLLLSLLRPNSLCAAMTFW